MASRTSWFFLRDEIPSGTAKRRSRNVDKSMLFYRMCGVFTRRITQRFVSPGNNQIAARRTNEKLALFDHRRAEVVSNCKICVEVKPRYCRSASATLIKAMRPMEHFSLDFKGPLPSLSGNSNLSIVSNEYYRFLLPFRVRIWQRQHLDTRVANLAFFKPNFEILAFFNTFGFFGKYKNIQNLTFF